MYLGSWKIDDYLTFPCNTHRADTGAASDADAVATYRIYEDETATPILTGSMALLDSVNTVGFYSERIQLTAANGLEKGKSYTIYITATVNSVVGTMSHTFQIEAEVDANVVSDKTGYGLADDAITAAKFDELTAFPVKSNDSGATQIARTGADSDTLENISDEIAALHNFNPASDGVIVTTNNDKINYGLADNAITAAKYDETTAFPIKSDDAGNTQIARTGADGDTLETLSDEIADRTGYALSEAGVDAIIDDVIEGTITLRQLVRVALSALAGRSTGGGTVNLGFRDQANSKNRITAVVDENGNRTSITIDGT